MQRIGGAAFDGVAAPSAEAAFCPEKLALLRWMQAAIIYEFRLKGWDTWVKGTALEGKAPVEMILNREPTKEIARELIQDYPVLWCGLAGEEREHKLMTNARSSVVTTWSLGYVLPGLGIKDYSKLSDVLSGFAVLVDLTLQQRMHPSYDYGRTQLSPGAFDVSSARVTKSAIGVAPFVGDDVSILFPAAQVFIETTSVQSETGSSGTPFEGASMSGAMTTPQGTINDFVTTE